MIFSRSLLFFRLLIVINSSSLVGISKLKSMSASASVISVVTSGSVLLRTSLKCSIHLVSCFFSDVKSVPCLFLTGISHLFPHNFFLIWKTPPILCSEAAFSIITSKKHLGRLQLLLSCLLRSYADLSWGFLYFRVGFGIFSLFFNLSKCVLHIFFLLFFLSIVFHIDSVIHSLCSCLSNLKTLMNLNEP